MNHSSYPTSRRQFITSLAGSGVAMAALAGCGATNVATGRTSYTGTYSIEDDIRIGREEHPRLLAAFGGEYPEPRLQRYLTQVGAKLAHEADYQQYPYRFTLLNSPIVNAFALPGGFVYLSRGLLALASSEAEMAGVVAHELGHVNARHGAERRSAAQIAQLGVLAAALGAAALGVNPSTGAQLGQGIAAMSIQGYSRKQEFEADTLGVRYMSRAGYDPDAMVSFLGTLREQAQVEAKSLGLPPGKVDEFNFMSTHPRTVDRVEAAARAANVERPRSPRIGREDYMGQIDGMLFGDDPSHGLISGRRFAHPGLQLEFIVPEGFRLQNSPQNVIATRADGTALVFDIVNTALAKEPSRHLREEWAPQAQLRDLAPLTVDGRRAATALAPARTGRGNAEVRLVAVLRDASSVFRFMFVTPGQETPALAAEYQQTVQSFRRLSRGEANRIKPLRLLVVPTQAGDTVDALARNLPYGSLNAQWFRVLNDLRPGTEPRINQRVKVIAS